MQNNSKSNDSEILYNLSLLHCELHLYSKFELARSYLNRVLLTFQTHALTATHCNQQIKIQLTQHVHIPCKKHTEPNHPHCVYYKLTFNHLSRMSLNSDAQSQYFLFGLETLPFLVTYKEVEGWATLSSCVWIYCCLKMLWLCMCVVRVLCLRCMCVLRLCVLRLICHLLRLYSLPNSPSGQQSLSWRKQDPVPWCCGGSASSGKSLFHLFLSSPTASLDSS